jgi:hypothetical protein
MGHECGTYASDIRASGLENSHPISDARTYPLGEDSGRGAPGS